MTKTKYSALLRVRYFGTSYRLQSKYDKFYVIVSDNIKNAY